MEDYHLDLHAPQWVDFTETCSPVRMPDFFEKKHEIHERVEDLCYIASENTETGQSMSEADVPCISAKAQANLDIMKSTPIKVISPKHRNNKETVTETTYDQVFSDAMRKLELCKKPSKTREALNKTTQELNVFKTPNTTKIAKMSRSIGYRSVPNKRVQSVQNSAPKSTEVNKNICILDNDTSANAKGTSVNHTPLKQDGNHTEDDTFKGPNNSVDNSEDKKEKQDEEEDNKECNEENNEECKKEDTKECNGKDKEHTEEDDKELQNESEDSTDDNKETKEEDNKDDVNATIEKANRTLSNKHTTVLTWYNHRRSLQKPRMSMNKKYISLAEAVSRFQNETPERFRTRSSKANVTMSFNMSKIMQNRLKPTIPISPALVSKNRTRPVTVLNREEREKLEMEEMKKYQIKANPIPRSVLRGSRVVMKTTDVSKKPTAAMNVSSMTQSSEKACTTSSLQPKSPQPHRDKASSGSKNMVTKVVVTDPLGIIVEREEIPFFGVPRNAGVTKKVTRVMPFSFEARNKNLQIKKEQRLKNMQEANNTKPEFHARPVPNFSKPPSPAKQQQKQQNLKKFSSSCPFSFDERDKKVSERKEQLVKQVFEEDKRARVFRANPAPVFKPVMVRGRSKECLLAKDNTKDSKDTQMASEQADKHEDQENREPNVDSSETKKENIQKTKNAIDTVDKQKAPLKAYSLKLNTDKRAKERRDFDEKIRRKEMEEEAKSQEVERKKLESEKVIKAELRKLMEVKARPMPMYKPPVIIRSQKLLTNPQSPAFASKKLRSKQT